ncbi:hypothetical protein ACYPKM_01855 [Pseudomonas aeruginosa]
MKSVSVCGQSQRTEFFEKELARKLRDHLRDVCILDAAGIERVMPNLLEIWVNGSREVELTVFVPDSEIGEDGSNQAGQTLQDIANETLAEARLFAFHTQEALMFAAAETLAKVDYLSQRKTFH